LGRWSVIDNKAEKYPGSTPFAYALNNPIKYIDPDGNDVKVSFTAKAHIEALKNMLSTEDGRAFIGRYMKANDQLYGYTFTSNGDKANDILEFQSANLYDPQLGGKNGDSWTFTKNGLFDADNVQTPDEVLGGFKEVIRLDNRLNEVGATSTLGHEVFVHSDKTADALSKINEKIKSGGYKNFGDIVKDLKNVLQSGVKDHEALRRGEVSKYKNFSKEMSEKRKNNEYYKKYEQSQNNSTD
jgi:hypothetical protein